MLRKVVQVVPQSDYTVYVYFEDGSIRLYNARPLINKGVFLAIKDPQIFLNSCTVMNGTLAWDISGNFDPSKCLDIDPETIFTQGQAVQDPLAKIAI